VPELGLFPLGLVLLPGERVPLHIFEPRYKELIGECIAEEREFGLLLADDDGLRQVGTRASVVQVLDRFDDGRLNIVIEGGDRFRLLELTAGRSFQTGDVEEVEDEDDDVAPDPDDAAQALDLYRRVGELAGAEIDELDPASGRLSFELAARVDFGLELKQQLLEERSEPERLKLLVELLEQASRALAVERERRERASRNGQVAQLGDQEGSG
jgi:Lon protease-like protein